MTKNKIGRPVRAGMFYAWKVWQRGAQVWLPPGTGDFRRCDFCGVLYAKRAGLSHANKYCSSSCARGDRFGFYPNSWELALKPLRRKSAGFCDVYSEVEINSERCRRREKMGCAVCLHLDNAAAVEDNSWKKLDGEEFI